MTPPELDFCLDDNIDGQEALPAPAFALEANARRLAAMGPQERLEHYRSQWGF